MQRFRFLAVLLALLAVAGCKRASDFDPRIPYENRMMKMFLEETYIRLAYDFNFHEWVNEALAAKEQEAYIGRLIQHGVFYRRALVRMGFDHIAAETLAHTHITSFLIPPDLNEADMKEYTETRQKEMELLRAEYDVTGDFGIFDRPIKAFTYCLLQPDMILKTISLKDEFLTFGQQNIFYADEKIFEDHENKKLTYDPDLKIYTHKDGRNLQWARDRFNKQFPDHDFDQRFHDAAEIYEALLTEMDISSCHKADYETYATKVPFLPISNLFDEWHKPEDRPQK